MTPLPHLYWFIVSSGRVGQTYCSNYRAAKDYVAKALVPESRGTMAALMRGSNQHCGTLYKRLHDGEVLGLWARELERNPMR